MTAVVSQPNDLAELQLAGKQADAVVGELVDDLAAVEHGPVLAELPAQAAPRRALAVGEDVEAIGDELAE
jgi:hypothetical protein